MAEKYETFKVHKSTLEALRLLSALTGNSMVDIVNFLVMNKLREVINENQPGIQDETEPDQKSSELL